MSIYRIASAVIALVSILCLLFVLPAQVDPFASGIIRPATIPTVTLALMAVCAVVMFFEPVKEKDTEAEFLIRLALIIAWLLCALITLNYLPFQYVMPVFALLTMVQIGERRWYWLTAGTLVPVLVWLLIEIVLGRPLP